MFNFSLTIAGSRLVAKARQTFRKIVLDGAVMLRDSISDRNILAGMLYDDFKNEPLRGTVTGCNSHVTLGGVSHAQDSTIYVTCDDMSEVWKTCIIIARIDGTQERAILCAASDDAGDFNNTNAIHLPITLCEVIDDFGAIELASVAEQVSDLSQGVDALSAAISSEYISDVVYNDNAHTLTFRSADNTKTIVIDLG